MQSFTTGDIVKTHFHERERGIYRTVVDVYPVPYSQSGVFIATTSECGKELAADSDWFTMVKPINPVKAADILNFFD